VGRDAEADSVLDAAPDASSDASDANDAAPNQCDFGTVTGNVFGQPVYFANGATVPAGRYRVTFVDGCMKYAPTEGWTVNAYPLDNLQGTDHWWFVSNGQDIPGVLPPGTVGFFLGSGGFLSFDACVQANLQLPPVDLDVPSGPFGVRLFDDPYDGNLPGLDGRSPTWSLQCLR
jgi:hypothetical protein